MSKQVETIRIVVHEPDLAVEEIRKFFRARSTAAEIWVERPEGRVCALVSGDRGWLMWLRSDGDPGLSSRDPAYAGPPDAEWPFVLGNGQVDYYPASWTLAATRVAAALEQFSGTSTMPSDVAWHDDAAGE
jgi:hypothetical protein